MQVLTVHQPFGDYVRGHVIKDADEIKRVLEEGRADLGHVVRSHIPDHFFLPDGEAQAAEVAAAKPSKAKA